MSGVTQCERGCGHLLANLGESLGEERPNGKRAAVVHWCGQKHHFGDDIADRSEGPLVGRALVKAEGVAHLGEESGAPG
jgi:hypothetical protein